MCSVDGGAETARPPSFQVTLRLKPLRNGHVDVDSQLDITVCTIGPGEYTEQGVTRYYSRAWVEI